MSGLTYGSVCSGIESTSVAWKPLGWKAAFLSEIEAFPRAVLKHHYPEVHLHGDFTTIQGNEYGPIDLLVGGTPCQSFSVAGLRGGMADDRGNLALQFLALAGRSRARWVVWENVPGVLSSNEGRDFGSLLGGLGELGYGWAYRTLDAQFFGLAQRRKRVFVVGYLGDWRRAAAVLFERASLSGHPAPSREAGKGTAAYTPSSIGGYREGVGTLRANGGDVGPGSENLIAFGGNDTRGPIDIATAVNAHGDPHGRLDFESETFIAHALRGEGFDAGEDGTGRGTPIVPVIGFGHQEARNFSATEESVSALTKSQGLAICFSSKDHGADAGDIAPTLRAGGHAASHANAGVPPAVAFALRGREGGAMPEAHNQVSALRAASGGSTRDYVAVNEVSGSVTTEFRRPAGRSAEMGDNLALGSSVRRLTPTECERLQGFPDSYTDVPFRGKPAADGPRYRALGNSMAVPCMVWIGKRIQMVHDTAWEKSEHTPLTPSGPTTK